MYSCSLCVQVLALPGRTLDAVLEELDEGDDEDDATDEPDEGPRCIRMWQFGPLGGIRTRTATCFGFALSRLNHKQRKLAQAKRPQLGFVCVATSH